MPRAVSPVIGLTLLIGVTVTLGTVIGIGLVDMGSHPGEPSGPVAIAVSASADDATIRFRHDGGRPIDVRAVSVRITIDGTPLTHQPPVPFFATTGFLSGPTGPFNPAADPIWTVGERARLRLSSSNQPAIRPGSTVSVTIVSEGIIVGSVRTTAT